MLEQARVKCAHSTRLFQSDCTGTPLRQRSADRVLASFLLSYLHRSRRLRGEAARLLRPGGVIHVSDLHPNTPLPYGWRRTFRAAGTVFEIETHRYTLDHLVEVMWRKGLRLEQPGEWSFGPPEGAIFERAGNSTPIPRSSLFLSSTGRGSGLPESGRDACPSRGRLTPRRASWFSAAPASRVLRRSPSLNSSPARRSHSKAFSRLRSVPSTLPRSISPVIWFSPVSSTPTITWIFPCTRNSAAVHIRVGENGPKISIALTNLRSGNSSRFPANSVSGGEGFAICWLASQPYPSRTAIFPKFSTANSRFTFPPNMAGPTP